MVHLSFLHDYRLFSLTLIARISYLTIFFRIPKEYSSTLIERFCASWEEFQANRAACYG
jgi:hypothetical protein